jgi:hypothetical protein
MTLLDWVIWLRVVLLTALSNPMWVTLTSTEVVARGMICAICTIIEFRAATAETHVVASKLITVLAKPSVLASETNSVLAVVAISWASRLGKCKKCTRQHQKAYCLSYHFCNGFLMAVVLPAGNFFSRSDTQLLKSSDVSKKHPTTDLLSLRTVY